MGTAIANSLFGDGAGGDNNLQRSPPDKAGKDVTGVSLALDGVTVGAWPVVGRDQACEDGRYL